MRKHVVQRGSSGKSTLFVHTSHVLLVLRRALLSCCARETGAAGRELRWLCDINLPCMLFLRLPQTRERRTLQLARVGVPKERCELAGLAADW